MKKFKDWVIFPGYKHKGGFDFHEITTNRGKSTYTRDEATYAGYLQALEYLKSEGIWDSVGDFYKPPLFLKDSI